MLYTVFYFVRIFFIRLFSIWFCECFVRVRVRVSVVQI